MTQNRPISPTGRNRALKQLAEIEAAILAAPAPSPGHIFNLDIADGYLSRIRYLGRILSSSIYPNDPERMERLLAVAQLAVLRHCLADPAQDFGLTRADLRNIDYLARELASQHQAASPVVHEPAPENGTSSRHLLPDTNFVDTHESV